MCMDQYYELSRQVSGYIVKVKVGLSLLLIKCHNEGAWGRGGIDPRIVNVGTRWIRVLRSMARLLTHQGEESSVPPG
jgi:hypothetical protein